MKTKKNHAMTEVWQTFQKRKDIEYSFIVSICSGLILFMIIWFTGLSVFEDILIGAPLLVGWIIFTTYFFVAYRGYRKSK